MKRSIALLGLFLPIIQGSTPLSQHPVQPAKRIVQYQNSRIPHPINENHSVEESKTQCISEIGVSVFDDDSSWFVHVDADYEHPDHYMKQILNSSIVYDDSVVVNRKAVSFRHVMLSLPSWLMLSLPKMSKTERRESSPRLTLEANKSNLGSNDYIVSAETEYDVNFGNVTYPIDDSTKMTQQDSSTVVYTSSTSQNNYSSDGAAYQFISATNITSKSIESNRRRQYRPLRIRSYLSLVEGGGQHLSSFQRAFLLQNITKPALLAWSAALRVDPVVGNLTVDSNQLVDGVLCGPGGNQPSITVPAEHLTVGVPNTDFILYINLAFTSKQTNETNVADFDTVDNSTTSHGVDLTGGHSTNASHAVNVTLKQQCFGDYLAASSFCSTDQFDRPTAAILHICIDSDFFHASKLQTNIRLVSHELGHVLGFNIVSLAHFRRPDGSPYTDRDPVTGAIPISEIDCTGPVGQLRRGMVALPSSEILQFRTVRGGVRVAEVVTPSVRQVVRNHFDCQDLPGAELESGEFLPLSRKPGEISCLGDHWERRLFKTDLMNPLIDDNVEFTTRFSTITLAYFADSGWYQVDLSRASLSAGWGRAAGCDFTEQTCVKAEDGQVPSNFNSFFCNQISSDSDDGFLSEIHGCTTDLTRKASCSLDRYEGELPSSYLYFNYSYGSNVGGADPFMDYCPVYAGFVNGLCSESANEALIKVNLIERFGQRNSRCLGGHISRVSTSSGYTHNTSESASSSPANSTHLELTALCLPIACVVEDRTLRIQVNGVWKVCTYKGELVTPPTSMSYTRKEKQADAIVATVVCPDPIRVCPTFFCHRDCLGTNRICDFNVGKCVCGNAKNGNATSDYISWNETSFTYSPEGNYSINETDVEICAVPNASAGRDGATGPFYEPNPSENDNGLPNSDSSLSDYYYKTERNLNEESSSQFWTTTRKSIVSGAGAFALLIAIAFFSYLVYRRRRKLGDNGDGGDQGGDTGSSTHEEASNPNKDKLMASVVVNLRVHDPALHVRRGDGLANRDSETELSMTDTEGTSEVPGSLDFSLEPCSPLRNYGGTIVDLSAHDSVDPRTSGNVLDSLRDDVACLYVDPLAPPTGAAVPKPVVRRRRHIFSRHFS